MMSPAMNRSEPGLRTVRARLGLNISKIGFAYSTPLPLNLEGIRGFFFLKYTS